MTVYLGRLATDHLRPSAFFMLTKANWDGDTFGESKMKIQIQSSIKAEQLQLQDNLQIS